MPNSLEKALGKKGYLISDGAMGSNLIARGLPPGIAAEQWALEQPEKIKGLHKEFIDIGSDIILTSTFGASGIRLARSGLSGRVKEVNEAAVLLSKAAAAGKDILIAGSMGPLGEILQPFGVLTKSAAYDNYYQQALVLSETGVDFLLIETQFDVAEAGIAVKAALQASHLPVICSFSFDRGRKSMMGITPSHFAQEIEPLGVAALGINCGRSLSDNLTALEELTQATNLPIWFKPNAGLPIIDINGQAHYDVSPQEMGSQVERWMKAGAKFIGGCCGTTPAHIQFIHAALEKWKA